MKGEVYTIPISHGEGRFMVRKKYCWICTKGQIATQYIDTDGNVAHEMPFNPLINRYLFGIEGITSESGKIFGRMGHPERFADGLFKNIPTANYHNIFRNGVEYFGATNRDCLKIADFQIILKRESWSDKRF